MSILKKETLRSKMNAVFSTVSTAQKNDFIAYFYLLAAQSPGFEKVDLSREVLMALDDFMLRAAINESMPVLERQKKVNTYYVKNPLVKELSQLIDEIKPPSMEGMVFSVEEWARSFFEDDEKRYFVAFKQPLATN